MRESRLLRTQAEAVRKLSLMVAHRKINEINEANERVARIISRRISGRVPGRALASWCDALQIIEANERVARASSLADARILGRMRRDGYGSDEEGQGAAALSYEPQASALSYPALMQACGLSLASSSSSSAQRPALLPFAMQLKTSNRGTTHATPPSSCSASAAASSTAPPVTHPASSSAPSTASASPTPDAQAIGAIGACTDGPASGSEEPASESKNGPASGFKNGAVSGSDERSSSLESPASAAATAPSSASSSSPLPSQESLFAPTQDWARLDSGSDGPASGGIGAIGAAGGIGQPCAVVQVNP
ncbi:hypothetical protein T484DRAFT_1827518 [Baffinella frigidus]|nr:hypothetical protein T484DRAFT_1827518 [Cryptophyta sp. CCMP2293]